MRQLAHLVPTRELNASRKTTGDRATFQHAVRLAHEGCETNITVKPRAHGRRRITVDRRPAAPSLRGRGMQAGTTMTVHDATTEARATKRYDESTKRHFGSLKSSRTELGPDNPAPLVGSNEGLSHICNTICEPRIRRASLTGQIARQLTEDRRGKWGAWDGQHTKRGGRSRTCESAHAPHG
ncbi:hypothetical protein BC629DRAFT_1597517 [Irpex lacteus]|nr:hypothetical protein BC629DRAFT_1597517 [Irpex lacteus]